MRAFSQLLDDLVYTRSRNTKLKLIGDYLRETPDPDRGYGLAALTGTLDIPAVKAAAVRAIAEERIDPVLLYMSRDYVGDMAETVALLWPKPLDEPPEVDDATIRITRGDRAAALDDSAGCAADARLDARPSRRLGALRAAQAGDRRASRRDQRAARQAGAGRRLRARGRGGRGGVARAPPAVHRTVRLGGRAGRAADGARRAGVPAVHARPSARRDEGFARRLCGRVEMGRDPRPARPCRRRDAALQPHRRRYFGKLPRRRAKRSATRGVLDGELLVRGSDQGVADVHGGAAASFNALQQRLGRKNVSQKMLGAYPAFVRLYDMLFDGEEDLARAAVGAAADAARSLRRRARSASGSTCRS